MTARVFAVLAVIAAFANHALAAAPSVHFAGTPVELAFAAVSENTLRFRLLPLDDGAQRLAVPASSVLVPLKNTAEVRIRELSRPRECRLGKFRLSLRPDPLTITIFGAGGRRVQELVLGTNWTVAFQSAGPILGLGEGASQFDRRGAFYPMINGQLSPLLATHGATIPVPFLIGTEGWALFVHRPWGEFDLREGKAVFRFKKERLEALDLFVIDAPEPAVALSEFIRLTGHPVMPPKWVMGYLQSHRTLLGPDDPLRIARSFREKHLPCDGLIYLGTGYCTNGWNTGHGSLNFNPQAFDHPPEQLQALHALNFKIILHINHAPRELFGLAVQPAKLTALQEDFAAPNHIGNYWARHRDIFSLGIDGWWPDDGDELPIEARLARHRCYYEGPLLDRPNVRPWSLHRNGFAGAARYGGWIWSGDTMSRWATLAAHVPVGLNYSLSLSPFWGSDTGGFVATSELTGELYTRWFQFSAFNPLFRSHGRTWHLRLPWGWDTGEYGPIETAGRPDASELHNAEVEPICRKYLELRYRLLPYNYTLMREACDAGLPPMRALWLHYPRDPAAVKLGDQYLWGRDILVAPVVEKAAKTRRLYLPAGQWYDFWTAEKIEGSRWLDREVDLATMPLYVRAGAIVPLDPVRQYTSEKVSAPTVLNIYPGADGSFTLYDDDGTSLDYQKNLAEWTRFRWQDRTRTLTIEPAPGSKLRAARRFAVVVVSTGDRKTVEYGGRKVRIELAGAHPDR